MGAVVGVLERLLGRGAGLVPPGRRGWVEAVRAEAGEVPAGPARAAWLAGGLWLVAREAKMIRRIGYGLAVVAVAVAAALVVRYLWDGAHAGRDAGWDKARIVLLVALLAGLPWVARRRQVFGPAGPSIAARAVRAGGSAAIVALVLDFARIEHFPEPAMAGLLNSTGAWNWAREAVALILIGACLAAVLIIPVRRPKVHPVLIAWCAAAAALILFFTLAPMQVLITVYAAGLLAVTSRRSPATPATLTISTSAGAGGGLLMVALWNPLQPGPNSSTTGRPMTLFALLVVLIVVATAAAGALAVRRAGGLDSPLARKARAQQYLAAGPLTAASAALMLPLFRDSHAVQVAAACPLTQHFHCTAAPSLWMFFLVAGPILGLVMGSAAAITPAQPPSQPPRRPPPPEPPSEPQPRGSRSGGVFVKI
jgi:hypothetical protein